MPLTALSTISREVLVLVERAGLAPTAVAAIVGIPVEDVPLVRDNALANLRGAGDPS